MGRPAGQLPAWSWFRVLEGGGLPGSCGQSVLQTGRNVTLEWHVPCLLCPPSVPPRPPPTWPSPTPRALQSPLPLSSKRPLPSKWLEVPTRIDAQCPHSRISDTDVSSADRSRPFSLLATVLSLHKNERVPPWRALCGGRACCPSCRSQVRKRRTRDAQ